MKHRKKPPAWRTTVLVLSLVATPSLHALPLLLSTTGSGSINGVDIRDGDIVRFDTGTGNAVVVFSEDRFGGNEDVDAIDMLANGNLLLSTENNGTLGGASFTDGDLIEYNPVTGTATVLFDESGFGGSGADINAVSTLNGPRFALSTRTGATLGSATFRDGDIVFHNSENAQSTLLFNEDLFTNSADIDALDILANGNIVFSTTDSETLGGLSFLDGDIVIYDPVTDIASLLFPELLFGFDLDIDALAVLRNPIAHVPEPATLLLLAAGLTLLTGCRATRNSQLTG